MIALVAALLAVVGLGMSPAQAGSAEVAAPQVVASASVDLPVPHGAEFATPWTCLQDQTWGSYYPYRIQTAVNSWNGPADFGMVYRGPATSGGVDRCVDSPAFPDNRYIKIGLWPAERHAEIGCAYLDVPATIAKPGGGFQWATFPIIYINYYKPICAQHAAADSTYMKNLISSTIGEFVGFRYEDLGTFYSVMNSARKSEIPYPTSNDLYKVNEIY